MNAVLARQGKRVKVSRRWELDHLRIEGAQYLLNPNSKVPVFYGIYYQTGDILSSSFA
jgi:hypothetical protein